MTFAARAALLLITAGALAAAGCHRRVVHESAEAIQVVLGEKTVAPGDAHDALIWADVREFYRWREGAPGWVTHLTTSKRTAAALDVLRTAPAHGLNPADYGEPEIAKLLDALDQGPKDAPDRRRLLADVDVRLTTGLMSLGRDVAIGHTAPNTLDPRWKAQRIAPDFVRTLSLAADENLGGWLASVAPRHQEYAALQKALAGLRQTVASTPGATAAAFYDTRTADGIRRFQEHHGLKVTGVADKATLASINVPIEYRIRQVEANLERWRWLPDELGARHLFVNIPLFQVLARDEGKTVHTIRVVVGKAGHETPIFSSAMDTVVFSPYWNIPDSIVEGETAPAVARNPQYLASHHIEILRVTKSGTVTLQPSQVNWDDPSELRQLAFRQLPGKDNALGHVKFLFPNAFSVYLHDTPADDLFARPGRAFSHGCVRVEEPETLAKYVLREDPAWTVEKISAAMHAGVESDVKLKQPIPVHIVYFTTWVDDNGGLHFQPDIYGYDAKQIGPKSQPADVTKRR